MMQTSTVPVGVAFASALLWGAWWLPVKLLEGAGIAGIWTAVFMIGAALPVLLVSLALKRGPRAPITPRTVLSGCLIGGAMALYTASITETTVVRAVLIFYLAPVWAILIETTFLGRRFRVLNLLAFGLAVLGLATMFRFDFSGGGFSRGDLIALVSGMCWAAGSALVFTGPAIGARRLASYGCIGAVAVSLAVAALLGHPAPDPGVASQAVPLAVLAGSVYIAPVLIATLWSARRLSPTTLSFLLTGEIVSGVGTAAWFLSEPFGWPETLGTLLIVSAALIEVVMPKTVSQA